MSTDFQSFDLESVKVDELRLFNFRRLDDYYFLSNDFGAWAILDDEQFNALVEGRLAKDDALYKELSEKGFVGTQVSDAEFRDRIWARRNHTMHGPILHALVLTERCNLGCQYCHSSIVGMKRKDTDMSIATAEQCVDFALQTPASGLTIEFQGGEPLANWEVLTHAVEYAREQNKLVGKELSFSLVSNMTLMTDERLDWLIENKVQLCTSIDGPEALHNKVRIYKEGNSWEAATGWLKRINARYAELGLDPDLYRAEALPTITRHSLPHYKEIVDTYVELGARAIFLRVLDPFGFAAASSKTLGYSMSEFLEFYMNSLEYIIELNKQGTQVMERMAAIMLAKIIGGYDPNYLDLRTPGGGAVGQVGYHPTGRIYTSDEGRMVAAMGDEFFHIGDVATDSFADVMESPKVRALVLASTNDGLPGCSTCAYKTYCGQQPEYNYVTQGSIQGRMPESTWCQKHMGIFDYLVRRLRAADEQEMEIFRRWTINRPQEYFLQPKE